MATITLIGAGNVAHHLSKRLYDKGHTILQVFSRQFEKAESLAQQVNAQPIDDLTQVQNHADLYILAIKDDAIDSVAQRLSTQHLKGIITHTSGATPSTVFAPYFKNYGIFYPLQTFSIHRTSNFEALPMCVDASTVLGRDFLLEVANSICPNVYTITDEQRQILHVAAVFVNNFTNHLLAIGEDILQKEHLPLDLLKPLIRETTAKIQEHSPKDMQTGPAVRGDKATINRHLTYLERLPNYHDLYWQLTKSIQGLK